MIFTVTYTVRAENALTNLYLNATDPTAVSAASNAIDRELRINAHQKGKAYPGDRRVYVVPPLLVLYQVSLDDRLVSVLNVQRIK